ncbi:hypothetical protein BKA67DRAFT_654940 [Truncatella angustata]|uniref:PRISE-like Rossmann-fold domain-containing protein n=1 Tax=Truncatella angustata TaxID=152316 RepID=A0A9P8ZZV7_9PEZI|nr:uncharacterized protein BKA67DRAFT_654940 [Truncatella angustata]KAH6656613.1 hypothetical protein BKA67DRAFT_654940 [Truncatella angustata]KAH8201542.1 hypothetical protein TruAng_004313 [Truncatella angustata]
MAHAFIFGASGISGWSLLNQTRNYPSPDTFARITGTTNRPLTLDKALIPNDDRIQLVSGVDLTKSVDEIISMLKEKVLDISTVTHVFFTAYVQEDDFKSLKKTNTSLLEVAARAIEAVAPKLQSIILQTGGKGYGLEFPKEVKISPPLKESTPRIPEPYQSKIFYYTQYDVLKELSSGKSWTFSEVRPDGIVGFAPVSNAMNMAQGIALYLSLYKEVNGKSASIAFPGYERGYNSTHSDTFQDVLSQMEIHAALNTDECGGGAAFNVADGQAVTWAQVWPKLCKHFGLVGTGPDPSAIPMLEFVEKHKNVWQDIAKRHGLNDKVVEQQGWGHVHFMMVDFDFDREYDLTRSREVGFREVVDTVQGYISSWERMRAAKFLPPL